MLRRLTFGSDDQVNAHHQKTIDPNSEKTSSASSNQDGAELAAVSAYLNAMLRECRPKLFEAMIWSGPGVFTGHDQLVPG